jgi:hypothetical protein
MPGIASAKTIRMIFETSFGKNGPSTAASATGGSAANGTIGEYTISDGTVTSQTPTLVPGLSLSGPTIQVTDMAGIAVSGNNLLFANTAMNTIGQYNLMNGAETTLVTGLHAPVGIAVEGDKLFVVNRGNGSVGEYTISGGTVTNSNPALITGLTAPVGIAVSGDNLFVQSKKKADTISEYNATTGATMKPVLVTGVHKLEGIAVQGSDLFFVDHKGTIGEYNLMTGVHTPLVSSGLKSPIGIAANGSDLFVVDHKGTIADYTILDGTVVSSNLTLITGLNGPEGIAVVSTIESVPDASSTWTLLLLGLAAMFGLKPLLRTQA